MKVGDLVVQLGWEADGFGIITALGVATPGFGGSGHDDVAHAAIVQWPGGEVNMLCEDLVVVSESR